MAMHGHGAMGRATGRNNMIQQHMHAVSRVPKNQPGLVKIPWLTCIFQEVLYLIYLNDL
jgi:F0F1-type ATP synthase membrane subunit c/vacuolar-type H+-ATPase subunit K